MRIKLFLSIVVQYLSQYGPFAFSCRAITCPNFAQAERKGLVLQHFEIIWAATFLSVFLVKEILTQNPMKFCSKSEKKHLFRKNQQECRSDELKCKSGVLHKYFSVEFHKFTSKKVFIMFIKECLLLNEIFHTFATKLFYWVRAKQFSWMWWVFLLNFLHLGVIRFWSFFCLKNLKSVPFLANSSKIVKLLAV